MKRLISVILVLVLCLTPVAYAGNYSYSGVKEFDILKRGDHGADVRSLQRYLVALGFLHDEIDGSYGVNTESAVWEFQRKNGITPTGVATLFTQAVLFGSNSLSAYDKKRSNTSTGDYGIRSVNVYRGSDSFDVSFEFVNKDIHNVEAICIFYWLDNGNGRLVHMNGWDYHFHYYYNCNTPRDGKIKTNVTLPVKSSEMKKAHQLRCIIGEIVYTDGSVVTCYNTSREPYESDYYLLLSW